MDTPRFSVFAPSALSDLEPVFERLERGESLALAPRPDGIPAPPDEPGPWLGTWSSGTTGEPRCAWQPWPTLRSTAAVTDRFVGWTWASPYRPDSFAGVQVALQAWCSRGHCLPLRAEWTVTWMELEARQPDALCCTPTFLALLQASEPTRPGGLRWMPRQITLGGEPLRPGLGPWIRQRFPEADFTAVYASAELGILAKSRRSDGWYDLSQLHERWDAWRIHADQLEVRHGETWFATGDRIQTDPEGLHFRVLGRAAAVANVAGTKVPLAEVESAAEEVPGVTAAQAWAEPNPVVGQVVALRYGLAPGATLDTVQPALERHLRQRLRKEAWPRRWEQGLPALGPNAKRSS